MSDKPRLPATSNEVSQFLDKVSRTPVRASGETGRLVFGMDATASRKPTWDTACQLQGEMFEAAGKVGNLSVQLCYYRGIHEFHQSSWHVEPGSLIAEMSGVRCLGGHTQIHRVLKHLQEEHRRQKLRAGIFIGDAMEENPDQLCHLAGQLGMLGVPLFVFQEGNHPGVKSVFQQMASLSGGAWAPFNLQSAAQLKDLLSAVAVFAAGGRKALAHFGDNNDNVKRLLTQLKE